MNVMMYMGSVDQDINCRLSHLSILFAKVTTVFVAKPLHFWNLLKWFVNNEPKNNFIILGDLFDLIMSQSIIFLLCRDRSSWVEPVISKDYHTVNPVLSSHLKIDKIKVFMENGSVMENESIAECSPWSILQYFWPALSDNWYWKQFFFVCVFFLIGRLRQVLLYQVRDFISVKGSKNNSWWTGQSNWLNSLVNIIPSTLAGNEVPPRHRITARNFQNYILYMCKSRKFCQRASNSTLVYFFVLFFSWWGERGSKYHFKHAIIGLPVKRHLNGVSLADRLWANIKCCDFPGDRDQFR